MLARITGCLLSLVLAVVGIAPAFAALPAPTGLAESFSGSNVTLSWSPVAGATGYAIRVHKGGTSYNPCESMVACSQISATSLTLPVEAGVSYDWWVHGVDGSGLGESSGRAFTVPAEALRSATITWFANTEADLAGYKLYRAIPCTGALALVKDAGNVLQTTDALPSGATEVAYALTAYDLTAHESAMSASICKPINAIDTAPGTPSGLEVTIQ